MKRSLSNCLLLLLMFATQGALARTIVVRSTADHGPGSLRQALVDASNGDTINLTANVTITLTSGELLVNKSVAIRGPGLHGIVSGNATSRAFHITPNTTVAIDGLAITNGSAGGTDFPDNAGGGIYSDHAKLTVSNCTLTTNSATYGGGIFSNVESGDNGRLTVNNTTLSNNSAILGGGIYNDAENGNASMALTNVTLNNNSARLGGGVYNDGEIGGNAVMTMTNCTVSGNSVEVLGGGIHNDGEFGHATAMLNNTAVSGNSSANNPFLGYLFIGAGGIFNDGYSGSAILAVKNSTVTNNTAVLPFDNHENVRRDQSADRSPQLALPGGGGVFATDGPRPNSGYLPGSVLSNIRLRYNRVEALHQDSNARDLEWSIRSSALPDGVELLVGPDGGGIWNHGYFGNATLTVVNSTISGNSAGAFGGGIISYGYSGIATTTVRTSAMSGNLGGFLAGAIYNLSATMSLDDSTITSNTSPLVCGGIINEGAKLTLSHCSVLHNHGHVLGGIGNIASELTVNDSIISNNSADVFGGTGIWNQTAGGVTGSDPGGSSTVTVNRSTISGNSEDGIYNDADSQYAQVTLNNSTISSNAEHGIVSVAENLDFSLETNATVIVNGCTINGNSMAGIHNEAVGQDVPANATLVVMNSTVSSNNRGIWNVTNGGNSSATVTNTTVAANFGDIVGGVANLNFAADASSSATMDITNTIINAGVSGDNMYNDSGVIASHGYNLSSDGAGGDNTVGPGGLLNGPGDIRNTNPLLGPLGDNGGLTMTHALLDHSPALNSGNPHFNPYLFNPPLFYDQRGPRFPRVVNGRIDIGAFEATHR